MAYTFNGGVHPATFKTLTSDRPIKKAFIPKKVILPLSQHTGSPSEPIVAVGDAVTVGQMIARPSGHISAALHATISGKVTRMAYSPTYNQARVLSITIEALGDEPQEFKSQVVKDVDSYSPEKLLEIIRDAGVVGLGGAAFPTHVKLSPPKTKPVDTVILNGAECEPYLTCDHRLMLEKSKEILKGLDVITKILGAKNAYIAIEDNKQSAIYAMEKTLAAASIARVPHARPNLVLMKAKYPQGAEKQVIKVITGRIVPAGGLPMDVGCVCQNVGTLFAIYEAVYLKKPLIERAITITGSCLRDPINLWVRFGTIVREIVPCAGGFIKEPAKVIAGGPMMGIAQYTIDIPMSKGMSGVVFMPKEELERSVESVCIRCGKCVEACPVGLVPTSLMYRVKKEYFAEAAELGIVNCYECGACAYSCPAKIPLLDYLKYGKSRALDR